ncbi:ATP-binding cassette domain-containing protein [Mycobacterium sp. 21AC1]|uniref:ATP-binding cassette domain-containing protein n=1 Tax=[Mycobacterium] appelbergii TaxID=2939269 RepID=UPI0029394CFE|nr:ATP-binding cassette domain-containing protein [Mycobacterium sp. 21AC1]MDV3129749.1 ATP-binding cassette domain-containing protein [Mycobacterium sp. 21AC1]
MTAAIRVGGVSKRFPGADPVLCDVELNAVGGTLTLVTGEPGAGLSTLLRCLTGVYRPDTGEVIVRLGGNAEVSLCDAGPRVVAWLRGQHIASFDGPLAAPPRLPAAVAIARSAGCSRASAAVGLDRLNVAHLATVPIGRLRTADRMTVALAAALLAQRPIVVLDDPGRWIVGTDQLTRSVRRATEAGAAVVATGPPGCALSAIAATTGELHKGRIVWHTP